jgi:hypothetical protein
MFALYREKNSLKTLPCRLTCECSLPKYLKVVFPRVVRNSALAEQDNGRQMQKYSLKKMIQVKAVSSKI